MALTAAERRILCTRIRHLRVQVNEVSRRLTDDGRRDGTGTFPASRCRSPQEVLPPRHDELAGHQCRLGRGPPNPPEPTPTKPLHGRSR
jgi:hypothetical protein